MFVRHSGRNTNTEYKKVQYQKKPTVLLCWLSKREMWRYTTCVLSQGFACIAV